jgi:hypothetical protein
MIPSNSKLTALTKIEFWAAMTLFVFVIFFFITDSLGSHDANHYPYNKNWFRDAGVRFDYNSHYFIPALIRNVIVFGLFLVLNFLVVPQLILRRRLFLNIIFVLVLLALSTLVFGITDTYLKAYLFAADKPIHVVHNEIFLRAFLFSCYLLLMLGFYTALKYACVYILANADSIKARYRFVTQGGLIAFIIWMITMFLLATGQAPHEVLAVWAVAIPTGILIYWWSLFSLIPRAQKKKRSFLWYLGMVLLVTVVSYLPISVLLMLFVQYEDAAFAYSFMNTLFQLLITVPLSWVVFKKQIKGNEEIYALKTELGKSNANLDFLRSQINPHFLFNALNTIYGTAIQEKAERTSEGIERLGDMMRFMLQENMQEKIPLAREIEYLNNYIKLQKLRTDTTPNIRIEEYIEQTIQPVQIAPMLLIPFVENAFKHGISFREPSHIKITLEVKENTLYFDVYNSKHNKPENDPEKNKSGIGLNNVKQRLQMMYPSRHELTIRETGKEFFIHLTIRLVR